MLIPILLVLILIMLVLIFIPVYRSYKNDAAQIGCVSSLNTANHQLAIHLITGKDYSAKEAKKIVETAMDGWNDLCPGGGTPYLIEKEEGEVPYEVVCGLHDTDTKEKTRLNAAYVLDQIKEQIQLEQIQGQLYPEQLQVTVNSKKYTAVLTDKETGWKRGATTIFGEEKIVIEYSITGHSDFGKDAGSDKGEIWYFSYGDEEHCATWSSLDGWKITG